ncbi:amylo-alpha-1,6-glucosidase [Flavobacterium sp. LB2P6]|uniref:amylo-alpha-1,6-glucosidase n=1 Tax=Flavobacterium sp. LB2P6 TaxID=3401714 RepID=UPI003AAF40BD
MKTYFSFLILIILFFFSSNATGQKAVMKPELAHEIKTDARLKTVYDEAQKLVSSGFNAGDGYSEVWIRDLNTFTELATKVTDNEKLKEALLTFFKFQGKDGSIMDGYTEIKNANSSGVFYYSILAPGFAAHKNTVETDQETSLVQALYKYIKATGDRSILKVQIDNSTVEERMGKALTFLLEHRFDKKHGLLWGATTADWGDVQPEHDWGVVIDSSSHFAIDIYDNAMFVIALNNYIDLLALENQKKPWLLIKEKIVSNTKKHLWDKKNNKYRTHIYLKDSPFPKDFDENKIYYHGGTAIAIEAGLLNKKQVKQAYEKMKANVKSAGAQTLGLTLYPVYPNGFFKNKGMSEYGYQNGGDWTWFGGRMVQQLIHYELYDEAFEALSPMLDRVLLHKGFYEWWTPAGEPKGSGQFRGSAGVLWSAIEQLNDQASINK